MEINITLVEGLLDPGFIFSKDELKNIVMDRYLNKYLKTVLAKQNGLNLNLVCIRSIHRRKRKLSTRN